MLKIYFAGKVDENSVYASSGWRDEFSKIIETKLGISVINFDPTKGKLDENNSKFIFGRDCYMIKNSDLVIVNLSKDISVGGSQEILIAKYFKKIVIAIAKNNDKFVMDEKIIAQKSYSFWIHPFVKETCDFIVEDVGSLIDFLKDFSGINYTPKAISIIDTSIEYYKKHHYLKDEEINFFC